MKRKSFDANRRNNRPKIDPAPKVPPKSDTDEVKLVVIRLTPLAFDYLCTQARMASTTPEGMLTLLGDIGRRVIEDDPLNPLLLQILADAGYEFYQPNIGARRYPDEDDELPY